MESIDFVYYDSIDKNITNKVKDFFINKDPLEIRHGYRLYSHTFTGLVMDKFYSYPILVQNLINEYNLIGLKISLEFAKHYVNNAITKIEKVTFTIYASNHNMVLVKLVPDIIIKDYLTKFNSML